MANIKAYGILVFVMFIWGINVPAVKYLTSNASPITMTSLRIFIAAIVVFIILYSLGIVRRLTKTEWKYVLIGSLLNVVLHHSLMSIGVSQTTSANASLIIGTGPILTAVLGTLLLKNLPTIIQWIGFIIGMLGIVVAVIFTGGETALLSAGDAFVFFSIFSQVFSFIIISKASKTMDPRLLTAYMFLIGSFTLAVLSLLLEPNGFKELPYSNLQFWAVLIGSGAIATALGHMLYNNTIPQVGAAKSSIFINLNTLFALIGSAILLGEPITVIHWISLTLIIIGVLLGSGAVEHFIQFRRRELK